MREDDATAVASPRTLNANVRVTLVFVFMLSASMSLYSTTTLASYIFLVTGSNAKVGFATGIQGVTNLALAIPASILGDRARRTSVLRGAAGLGLVASAFMAWCITWVAAARRSALYLSLCASAVLWGAFMGGHTSTLEAIFADSVASGARSKLYVWKASLRTLGNVVGPLVSIVVFWRLGNDWEMSELKLVILGGMGLFVVPFGCLLLLSDEKTLGLASESLLEQRADAAADDGDDGEPDAADAARCGCLGRLRHRHIPAVVACSDLISAMASGMTIKFFPLYFWRRLHLSPIAVNAVVMAGPMGISVLAIAMQKLSKRIGRVQTTLLTKFIGVSLLVAIALLDDALYFWIIPLYLVRTWVMNCTSGLTKSILNDYVSKKRRAKWNGLESVNIFSWSGSAALGGVLIDTIGYRGTFLITAAMQGTSALLLSTITPLVHMERSTPKTVAGPADAEAPPTPAGYALVGDLADDEAPADDEKKREPA